MSSCAFQKFKSLLSLAFTPYCYSLFDFKYNTSCSIILLLDWIALAFCVLPNITIYLPCWMILSLKMHIFEYKKKFQIVNFSRTNVAQKRRNNDNCTGKDLMRWMHFSKSIVLSKKKPGNDPSLWTVVIVKKSFFLAWIRQAATS